MLIDLIKTFVPGSGALLLAGLLYAGAALLVRPAAWRRVFVCVGIFGSGYALLSLPWTASTLAALFVQYPPIEWARKDASPDAIVLLGGDHVDGRIRETLRLYALLQPRWVIVSGEPFVPQAAIDAGLPADRMLYETASKTTREQALAVRDIARAHDLRRLVLVASTIHMPRAFHAFRAVGLDVVPAPPSVPHGDLPRNGVLAAVPRVEALHFSSESLYEYLALAYYWSRGWLAAA